MPRVFWCVAGHFAWLCAPECHFDYLAVRLTLGAHQSVPVHIHRGRDLGVPHQLLLHCHGRSTVIQPGPGHHSGDDNFIVGPALNVAPQSTPLGANPCQ